MQARQAAGGGASANNVGAGVFLGLLAAWCLSTQDLFVKLVVEELHILQLVFLRSFIAAALAGAWVVAGGWNSLKTHRPRLVTFRVVCNFIAWFCYFVSLTYLPLAVYTCLGASVFLFAAVLSAVWLKEPPSGRAWVGIIAGFCGVVLLVNPFNQTTEINQYAALLLLFGAFMWALALVATRALGKSISVRGIIFYTNLALLVIGAMSTPFVWQPPSSVVVWGMVIAVAVLSFIGQIFAIMAYSRARVTVVIPTQYTMLIWATLYAWLLWGQVPDERLLISAALIIGGGILTISSRQH